MADLRKVNPGEPLRIPAGTYNTFIDTANAVRSGQAAGAGTPSDRFEPGVVLIQNASGAARARFEVLQVSGALITPAANLAEFQRTRGLTGVMPTQANDRFVVLLEPIRSNEIGRAMVVGVVPVQVNVTDASHTCAVATASDATKLTSGHTGAALVWKESGTGTKWALVRLGGDGGIVSSPTVMNTGTEDLAKTDAWDRQTGQATAKGVQLAVGVRVIYDAVTNQVLRRYVRTLTWDSKGCLKSISTEAQGDIATPEAC